MAADQTSEIVASILDEFGLQSPTVELLDSTDHCNAKIIAGSNRYFLKALASGSTEAALRFRLQFTDFLRDGGLPIPAPLPTTAGRNFASAVIAGEQRLAVLTPWIDGKTLGENTDPRWIEKSGELLARFHIRAQAYEPAVEIDFPSWDEVYAPVDQGWLPSFLADSPVDVESQPIIEKAAAKTRTLNMQLPKDRQNYWLIHADFHGDNLILADETIWILDFEDVGWGHLLFDVVWPAILFAKHHPDAAGALEPLLRGYESVRPFSALERDLLPEFQLAAGLGALEMIHTSPVAHDDPLAQQWFDFIVNWLRRNLS